MAQREVLLVEPLDGYEPEVGSALWRLEEGRERTLRLLRRVTGKQVDQEVDGNSIGTILYHLALIEADWLFTEMLERPIPDDVAALLPVDDRDADGILMHVRGQALDEHLARLATVRAGLLAELRGLTIEELHRPRACPNYDVSPAWVLHHLAQHEAEHRGELGAALARLG